MTTNTKIIVLGGAGMLGHKMFQVLRRRFQGVLCTTLQNAKEKPCDKVELLQGDDVVAGVDVTSFEDLRGLLARLRPGYIVNCVGIIKQRAAAACHIPSIMINSLLPHILCETAAGWGGRVIHFSTDCVFSGTKGAYSEQDPSDAQDLYGRTKFLGETAAPNGLTLRTSIIGRELLEHRSLLDWFLSQNGQRVRGFRKAIYSGVTTNHLAETVAEVIEKKPQLSGLYQVASEPISKFDLLRLLRDAYRLDIEIEPDDTEVCDRSMLGMKFREATGFTCPDWPDLVRCLAADPTPYRRWLS
jgi:dTDP-4-dehydrorhamnose reductase